jgi:hypothetical protein
MPREANPAPGNYDQPDPAPTLLQADRGRQKDLGNRRFPPYIAPKFRYMQVLRHCGAKVVSRLRRYDSSTGLRGVPVSESSSASDPNTSCSVKLQCP